MTTPELQHSEVIHDIPDHWTRDQKIKQLLSVAQMLSRTWHIRPEFTTMEASDIYQVAASAIVRAVDAYDPSRGVKLTTFAINKAKWAVVEACRDYSHAPRSLVAQGQLIKWVLFSQERSTTTFAENDDTVGDYVERTQYARCGATLDSVVARETRNRFYAYIDQLPERERGIIENYIFNDMTYREISKIMHISEARVYQLAQRAITMMRDLREKDDQIHTKASLVAAVPSGSKMQEPRVGEKRTRTRVKTEPVVRFSAPRGPRKKQPIGGA